MIHTLRRQPLPVLAIWLALGVEFVAALYERQWAIAYLAAGTFALSLLPTVFARRFGIELPRAFLVWMIAFIFATIFLGEAFDYYERFWWWDVAMHSSSALGFGLLGVLFMLMLFEGDRYAAPPSAIAFFGFCLAVTVGTLWEIFEFGMDSLFGLNMQKSGLPDTMGDLIVNGIGAGLGALAGFLHLKGRAAGGLGQVLDSFIDSNRRFFRRFRR